MAFVILLMPCLLALAGLVAEGGMVISAKQRAMAEAEQAARAGAAKASVAGLHDGLILAPGDAPAKEAEFVMAADGHPGVASTSGGRVTATVEPFSVATPLLALAGVPHVMVSARATAQAIAR